MRATVPLDRAYLLLNHGPTVLVSSAHAGRRNVMAAAWACVLDFAPPKLTVVIDAKTYTRELVEASGEFVLNLPCRAIAETVVAVGSESGRDAGDKFARHGLATCPASRVAAPLVEACVAWLECRLLPEPQMQKKYDLFLAEVVAAWADERVFSQGRWHFDDPQLATIHHVSGGRFFATGEAFATAQKAPKDD